MARFWEIDAFRGIAIIMMTVFHFMWDLKYFGLIGFDLYSGFWGYFQIATAGLFLLLVGVVLTVSAQRHQKVYPIHFLKRGALIFGAGLLITAITYLIFPDDFIYFGVLQLIGVSIILSIPLVKRRFVPLVAAVIVIALSMFVNLQQAGIGALVWLGLAVPRPTFDFEPLFPWFGAVLIGIFLGNLLYFKGKRAFKLGENNSWLSRKLQFLGRNSLLIYLLHQPIIFGAVYLAASMLH